MEGKGGVKGAITFSHKKKATKSAQLGLSDNLQDVLRFTAAVCFLFYYQFTITLSECVKLRAYVRDNARLQSQQTLA